MAETTQINGIVVDGTGRKSLAGLRVEAWGKGLRQRKAIVSGKTSSKGRFTLKIKLAELEELFRGKSPKLYFKILDSQKTLVDTSGSVEWAAGSTGDLKIVVAKDDGEKDENEDDKNEKPNEVGGQVRREDGRPFPAAPVRAFHAGAGAILRLGEDTTDTDGRYTIRYSRPPGAGSINLQVTVFSADGAPLSESDVIRKAKQVEIVDLTVPVTEITTFHVAGRVASRVSASIGGLDIRIVDKTVGDDVLLAEAVTGEDGAYGATFTDTALHERGKTQPDLQAQVVRAEKVIGVSPVRYNAATHEKLDVLLEGEEAAKSLRSEYETLTETLASHFSGSLADLQETEQRQDITHLAHKTGWDARAVAMATLAEQFSATAVAGAPQSLEPAFFYALFRAWLPTTEAALYRLDPAVAENVWNQAVDKGVIAAGMKEQIPAAVARFKELAASKLLDGSPPVGLSPLKDLLAVSLGADATKQQKFAELYTEHRGDYPKLWEGVRAEFGDADEKRLRLDGKFAYLTLNNAPLIGKLHQGSEGRGLTSELDLIIGNYHRTEAWKTLIGADSVPPEIKGTTAAEKRKNYAGLLAAKVRLSYPTAVIAEAVKNNETPLKQGRMKNKVHAFLTSHHGAFEIGVQPVAQFVAQNELNVDPEVVREISRIQRVYQITPNDESMNALLGEGVDSAYAVTRYSRDSFVRKFKNQVDGENQAQLIHDRARQIHSAVLNIAVSYGALSRATGIGVHSPDRFVDPTPDGSAADVFDYSNLEQLFGEIDYCDCEHCRSILSPAAYLTDLLLFLHREDASWQVILDQWRAEHGAAEYPYETRDDWDSADNPDPVTPLEVLLERRPDIEYLPLTCENTNTALPYIDLVNETLEYYVVNDLTLKGYEGHSNNGDVSSGDLMANPQFLEDRAYRVLAGKPLVDDGPTPLLPPAPPLPFHQPLESLRRYFDRFEAPLPRVMEALRENENLERPDPPADPAHPVEYGWRDVWMEEIRMSRAEYKILTDKNLTLRELYGYGPRTGDADIPVRLSNAKEFSRRVGITYEELVEILKTRFVNPNSTLIPRLERLGVSFAMLKALKDGAITDPLFDDALAPHLDSAEYGGDIKAWVKNQGNYDRIMSLLTLANPESPGDLCSFDKVTLRYADPAKINDPVRALEFVRLIRFIRIWKKLGWTIDQTDKAITALYPTNQSPDDSDDTVNLQRLDDGFLKLLPRLGVVSRVMDSLKLKPNKHLLPLLACFAPIDTHGAAPLYRQMFLSPALLEQGEAFADDGYGNYLDGSEKLADHTEILRAAFQLTEDELSQIIAALEYDENTQLNVGNITAVFRHGWLARNLKLSIPEFLLLIQYTGIDPFTAPDPMAPPILRLIDLAHRLRAVSLKPAQALYLIWNQDISGRSVPEKDEISGFARTLRAALTTIESEFAFADDPDGQIARARMTLVYGNEATDLFFGLLNKNVLTDVDYSHGQPTLEQPILDAASDRVAYDHLQKKLSYIAGVMPDSAWDDLKAASEATVEFRNAVDSLYAKTRTFFDHYPELKPLYDAYDASGDPVEKKRSDLLASLLPGLKYRRKRQQVLEFFGAAAKVDTEFAEAVIDDAAVLHAGSDSARPALDDLVVVGTPGLSAEYFFRDTATGAADQTSDAESDLAYTAGGSNTLPANPAPEDTISGIWSGYIEAPENGPYGFRIETEAAATVAMELDGAPMTLVQDGNIWSNSDLVDLRAGKFYALSLTVENVKDNLTVRWETTERRWEVIPPNYLYNPVQFGHLTNVYVRFLKIASLAAALKLTAAETAYLASHPDYWIDGEGWLNSLPVTGSPDEATSADLFRALDASLSFARLKADLSPGDERLLAILKDPVTATQGADSLLFTLARWEPNSLNALLARLGGVVDDLGRPEFFQRIYDAYAWAKKLGVPATALIGVATNEPDNITVRDLQAALRARHEESSWFDVVKPINDEMRALRRNALVVYILHQMRESGTYQYIDTPEKLFEYFLMDVQMEPCTLTSRIRHALSSVQLFIDRCLMNLEPRVLSSEIGARRWEWMSRYRMWEANRKVFLYPENWLEPELRYNQSPFFKQTMSELLESDITEDRAAAAILNYLSKLDEVAKLEPCGIHYSEYDPADALDDVAHVVARTAGASRKYYYRRRQGGGWTPWEPIKLDIDDNPVIPVVWNDRLFLFWLKILKEGRLEGNLPFSQGAENSLTSLNRSDIDTSQNKEVVKAVLCWSEYYNEKWQSANTSDIENAVKLGQYGLAGNGVFKRSGLKLVPSEHGKALRIAISGGNRPARFILHNTHSLPIPTDEGENDVSDGQATRVFNVSTDAFKIIYSSDGKKFSRNILNTVLPDDRAVAPTHRSDAAWNLPYFYEDSRHVFYVTSESRIVPVTRWEKYWVEVPLEPKPIHGIADPIEISPDDPIKVQINDEELLYVDGIEIGRTGGRVHAK